jgi:hypothetical protein
MVDPLPAIIGTTLAGAFGGFLHSWMSFNATGEKFDAKKHGNAIIVGILTGLAYGAAISLAGLDDLTKAQYWVLLIAVLTSAAGIDTLRAKLSKMIKKKDEPAVPVTKPEPTPLPEPKQEDIK